MNTASTKNPVSNSGITSGSLPWIMGFDLPAQDMLLISLSGDWEIANHLPDAAEVDKQMG